MDTKLRIDAVNGVVEAEGSEGFVRSIYDDFRDLLITQAAKRTGTPGQGETVSRTKSKPKKAAKRKGGTSHESHSIVKDLDLVGRGKGISLKEFVEKYNRPRNSKEWNVLFTFYLKKHASVAVVTADHIFTCYKHVNARPPSAFNQSLWDTARGKGWLDTSSLENIGLPMSGENHVEHDMPKQETSSG